MRSCAFIYLRAHREITYGVHILWMINSCLLPEMQYYFLLELFCFVFVRNYFIAYIDQEMDFSFSFGLITNFWENRFFFFPYGEAFEMPQHSQFFFFSWLIQLVNSFTSNNYSGTLLLSRRDLGQNGQFDMESQM